MVAIFWGSSSYILGYHQDWQPKAKFIEKQRAVAWLKDVSGRNHPYRLPVTYALVCRCK